MDTVKQLVQRLITQPQPEHAKSTPTTGAVMRRKRRAEVAVRQITRDPLPSPEPQQGPLGDRLTPISRRQEQSEPPTLNPSGSPLNQPGYPPVAGVTADDFTPFSAQSIAESAASHPKVAESSAQTSSRQPTVDLRRYAIGATGEHGRMGLSQIETAALGRAGSGPRARLVIAIEDYLNEGMTRHTASLMRAGILPPHT